MVLNMLGQRQLLMPLKPYKGSPDSGTCPNLQCDAATFVVQVNASADRVGAVLEQDDHVIAYASQRQNVTT